MKFPFPLPVLLDGATGTELMRRGKGEFHVRSSQNMVLSSFHWG